MKTIKLFLSLALTIPLFAYSQGICSEIVKEGYIMHHSNMESRKDGNIKETLNFMLGRPESQAEVDTRSETERLLGARQFKTWFDFKNRTADYFSRDLKLKPALVKHVATHQEGLLSKLMMIRQAKFTVDATYYIFHTDNTGYVLINEFKEALRRGVSVRFMIDSLGSVNPKSPTHPELKALGEFAREHAGFMKDRFGNPTDKRATVEVLSFRSTNPVQLLEGAARKTFRLAVNKVFALLGKENRVETVYVNPNRRSHDKILITDANFPQLSVAIIGGRNISDSYYGIPKADENTYVDLEVIVKNDPDSVALLGRDTITSNIGDLYDQLYFHSANRVVNAGLLRRLFSFNGEFERMEKAADETAKSTEGTLKALNEDFRSENFGKNYLSTGFSKGDVDLSYTIDNVLRSINIQKLDPLNQNNEKKNVNHIAVQFEKMLGKEREHIMIVSPYLWLSPEQISKFKNWLGQDSRRKLTIITNSIMTSDNILAQTLVDAVLGPQLLLDTRYLRVEDNSEAWYDTTQVKIFEYGRLDSKDLGGTMPYGKLHAKGISLQEQKASAVTTFNGDPRSLYLNSETGLGIYSVSHSQDVRVFMDKLISESHEWGSAEYHAIRKHPRLPAMKRKAAANVEKLYNLIVKLRLDWLI